MARAAHPACGILLRVTHTKPSSLLLAVLFLLALPADGAGRQHRALQIADVPVVTHDGERVRFYADLVQGKVVALNFIFTTCTTICPPMGAIFSRLQGLLGAAAGRDVHLLSVTVDPVTDTPPRLKAWGQRFDAGPGWTLVTGEKADIVRLLKSLQVFTPDPADHVPTVLVGNDAAGAWTRTYGLSPPAELHRLLNELREAESPR